MKITWAEIKKNLRVIHREDVDTYESERRLIPDYEFEFNLNAEDIDYYMLSGNTINAITRAYSLKEMFEMGLTNWDGENPIDPNWKYEESPSTKGIRLPNMQEYAAMFPNEEK
jgi:hypothetical protein